MEDLMMESRSKETYLDDDIGGFDTVWNSSHPNEINDEIYLSRLFVFHKGEMDAKCSMRYGFL
jgi:hypothetical protein